MKVRRVEQHIISRSDATYREIDEMAFASKNLWNLANYQTRQAFLFEKTYLKSAAWYPTLKHTDANPRLASQSGESSAHPTRQSLEVLF